MTPLLILLRFHAATSTQTQTIQYCQIKLKKKTKGCVKNTVLCIVHRLKSLLTIFWLFEFFFSNMFQLFLKKFIVDDCIELELDLD